MTTKDMLEQSERTGELTTEETANVGRTGNGPSQLSAADLAQSGNFCAWDNLTPAQQRMLSMGGWTGYSAQQQQEFMNITVAAEAIGIDLSGLTVSSITIAGQNGATRTELNLTGSSVAVGALNSQLTGSGNFSVNTFLGGLPHSGFTDNFRQMVRFWSIQINTNTATGAVQIDIDRFNPACGALALIAHGCQVLWHFLTGTDTSVLETADALGGALPPVSLKRL